MSVFKKKNAASGIEIKNFDGIDSTMPADNISSAYNMENFRVMPDSSLEKRCGFAPIGIFSQKVRAVWSGRINGTFSTYIIHGNAVSLYDDSTKTVTRLGTLLTSSGNATFIFVEGCLYIIDGEDLYQVFENYVTIMSGYIPLIGKDWKSAVVGEEYEPLNYLTSRVRITYVVDKPVIYLCTKYDVQRIEAVVKNGVLLNPDEYYYDSRLLCLCVLGLEVGDTVEAFLSLTREAHDTTAFLSCTNYVIYGTNDYSRLFLWGGNQPNLMFGPKEVDSTLLEECRKWIPYTLPLYFPVSSAFTLGKEGQKITAVTRHYDRLLIFTDIDTWMATSPAEDGQKLEATIINSHNGCTSFGASLLCGNDPVCVGRGSVLRWTRDTDELNECNAYSISTKIEPLLDLSFFDNAIIFHDRIRSELLFTDPIKDDGTVWIYNINKKCWYKFWGIHASLFFDCNGRVGFVNNNIVYAFDDSLTIDTIEPGDIREISAYIRTQPLKFSSSSKRKRIFGITLDANFDGGSFYADCITENKIIARSTIGSSKHSITGVEARMPSPRFSYTLLNLTASIGVRQRLYRIGLWGK